MADFFSQFQVHPPNDFNLGGFQPEIFAQDKVMYPNGHPNTGIDPNPITWNNDPRLSTLPQPSQQGPGGTQGPMGPVNPTGMFGGPDGQRYGPTTPDGWRPMQNDNLPPPSDWNPNATGQQPLPDWMQKKPVPMAGATLSGGLGGPIQQQMAANGGFYAPPPVSRTQQPMNPSQQSGALGSPMVQMTGPDGSQQFVDPQHVPHYQGLGAQVTGQQLAGMSGSSYGGG